MAAGSGLEPEKHILYVLVELEGIVRVFRFVPAQEKIDFPGDLRATS